MPLSTQVDHRALASELLAVKYGVPPNMEAAVRSIAHSLVVIAQPDDAVRAMRAHTAETDHALTLRLIDIDVFAVHCIPNCPFHTEWRIR